jgi:hypothetical protein
MDFINYKRSILIGMLYSCWGLVFGIYPKGQGRDCVCFVLTFLITELCCRQTPMTHKHSNSTFRCNIDLQNNSAQLPSFTCEYRRSSIPNKLLAFLPIYKLEFPPNIWQSLIFQSPSSSAFPSRNLCGRGERGRGKVEHLKNWSEKKSRSSFILRQIMHRVKLNHYMYL